LEREGAHVAYGVERLKTHVKLALVVREEADGIRRYVHVEPETITPSRPEFMKTWES
jgi:polyphosphate kinase